MKKLIEELEKAKIDTKHLYDGEYILAAGENAGIDTAIEIVKSYDPWIPVVELPPPIIYLPMVSITVLLTDGVVITTGYYDYEVSEWVDMPNPTHWTYLPEVKE